MAFDKGVSLLVIVLGVKLQPASIMLDVKTKYILVNVGLFPSISNKGLTFFIYFCTPLSYDYAILLDIY